MRKLILLHLILFGFTSVASAGVNLCFGDTVTPDTTFMSLPEMEVTAASVEKSVSSATPFQKINAENIKINGITDFADAMNRLPGVNIRDYGGAGGLKTISVRGLGAAHTAVVYDGVALSDCQSGQIDLSRYSLDNVSSISLFSGDNDDIFIPARAAASASSLYISSFTTPPSGNGMKINARMKAGSYNYYNPFFRISRNYGRRGAYSANFEYLHSDNNYSFRLINGQYVTKERRSNSEMDSWHGELNGRWSLGESLNLASKIYYYDNSRNLPGPVIYYVSSNDEKLRERNFFTQLQLRGRVADKLSLFSTLKFNWAASRYRDYALKYVDGLRDDYYIQRETYATAAFLYTPVYNLSFDYSIDWGWNNLSSNLKKNVKPYRNSLLQTIAAKYSRSRISLMARLLYSLYLNDAKDGEAGSDCSRFSPMVSVSVKPFEERDIYFRASYKNIFRVPTFNEAYFDNYGSLNLKPEITDQYNIGVTYQGNSLGNFVDVVLTCDAYYNKVKNKIVAVPYNLFIWSMSNLGKVRVLGVDATLSADFRIDNINTLNFSASYAYQRAQPRTSRNSSDWMKQVAYIPKNSGSFSLAWLNPWVNFTIHSTGMSDRYTTNANIPDTRISGFIECGFSLSHTFKLSKCSFDVKGETINAFDKQYEIVAHYPMPGRTWRFGVEFDL